MWAKTVSKAERRYRMEVIGGPGVPLGHLSASTTGKQKGWLEAEALRRGIPFSWFVAEVLKIGIETYRLQGAPDGNEPTYWIED